MRRLKEAGVGEDKETVRKEEFRDDDAAFSRHKRLETPLVEDSRSWPILRRKAILVRWIAGIESGQREEPSN